MPKTFVNQLPTDKVIDPAPLKSRVSRPNGAIHTIIILLLLLQQQGLLLWSTLYILAE